MYNLTEQCTAGSETSNGRVEYWITKRKNHRSIMVSVLQHNPISQISAIRQKYHLRLSLILIQIEKTNTKLQLQRLNILYYLQYFYIYQP